MRGSPGSAPVRRLTPERVRWIVEDRLGRHLELGREGEERACGFLERRGYRILNRNYRCPYGEVDIIASRGKCLVFCEVKTRSGGDMVEALGAVDARRQGRMARTAAHYLSRRGGAGGPCRFDVIALLKREGMWKIEHVKDAFEIGEL
jgi:putative endonuclease